MEFYPDHIEGYIRDAAPRFFEESDAYHHYFQLICQCGSVRFQLFRSNRSSVTASCEQCGESIVVYDLAHYPAASKISGEEEFVPLLPCMAREANASVFVMYEYGELDDDQEFDRNDITWCQVFVVNEAGELIRVFDDETA